MLHYALTPAAGKRLIAKATARHPAVQSALNNGTLVVVAGTTNGYVAEEILNATGQGESFSRAHFFRGLTTPPGVSMTDTGRLPDESAFPGDVVLVNGQWQPGKTIFDVVDALKPGDVILKGANAVHLARRQGAVLIGHPKGGTIVAALQAVVGRRVRLLLPVGLEKRIDADLNALAVRLNAPDARGSRLLPVPGEILTELDAVTQLTGATAELIGGGGVLGAEGAVWLAVSGTAEQEKAVKELVQAIRGEPAFSGDAYSRAD